jgi:hypothetical protein
MDVAAIPHDLSLQFSCRNIRGITPSLACNVDCSHDEGNTNNSATGLFLYSTDHDSVLQ